MLKRWVAFILLGKLFNNPNTIYKLEEKLANSAPIRQLARTLVALFQRGLWEIKQIKSIEFKPELMKEIPFSKKEEELRKSFEKLKDDLKKGLGR